MLSKDSSYLNAVSYPFYCHYLTKNKFMSREIFSLNVDSIIDSIDYRLLKDEAKRAAKARG